MARNSAAPPPVRVRLAEPLVVEIHGRDGSHLRVWGVLDSAPDRYTGDFATWLVLTDAVGEVLPG